MNGELIWIKIPKADPAFCRDGKLIEHIFLGVLEKYSNKILDSGVVTSKSGVVVRAISEQCHLSAQSEEAAIDFIVFTRAGFGSSAVAGDIIDRLFLDRYEMKIFRQEVML